MITAPVRSIVAFADGRLDAKYHLSPGVQARERLQAIAAKGVRLRQIAGEGGLGSVGATSRTKRVYAAPNEDSVPYLRPYDVFDYLPKAADLLSKTASKGITHLMPTPGTILQTCSGRNLGPLAYADAFISRFVVSDDMLRLHIEDEADRIYAFTFLSTPTGQALLTRSKTGNVIDHLSANDLGAVEVPFINADLTSSVVELMKAAIQHREDARIKLDALIAEYATELSTPDRTKPLRDGWTQKATGLGKRRLDAAFFDPHVAAIRDVIASAGGIRIDQVADMFMLGQYKRYYVAEGHGEPILSGRQLLQTKPVHLQYIAARSLDFASYALTSGMTVFGARGRAEERLAEPALITDDRAGWLASHNVLRVSPKTGVNPGWLYLCLATPQVQAQIKASAFGSVIDVVTPEDLGEIMLPPADDDRGSVALQCWQDLALANSLEADAVTALESAMQETATGSV